MIFLISPGGYKQHITETHNMWNYLYYIGYLKDKKETELTGFESYVKDKIDNNDISWFPIDIEEEVEIPEEPEPNVEESYI